LGIFLSLNLNSDLTDVTKCLSFVCGVVSSCPTPQLIVVVFISSIISRSVLLFLLCLMSIICSVFAWLYNLPRYLSISIHISVHDYVSIFIYDTTITTVFTRLLHTYRRTRIYIHTYTSATDHVTYHGFHASWTSSLSLCHVISSFISWFSSSLRFSLVVLIFLVTCSLYERKSKSLQPRLCVLDRSNSMDNMLQRYIFAVSVSLCVLLWPPELMLRPW
jgi:hypothetical protein